MGLSTKAAASAATSAAATSAATSAAALWAAALWAAALWASAASAALQLTCAATAASARCPIWLSASSRTDHAM